MIFFLSCNRAFIPKWFPWVAITFSLFVKQIHSSKKKLYDVLYVVGQLTEVKKIQQS